MDFSYVLVRFFGIYLAVLGVAMFIHAGRMVSALEELVGSKLLQLFAGVITLLMGAFLVSVHNRWDDGLSIAVSVGCWMCLFAGVFRLVFTNQWIAIVKKVKVSWFRPMSVVCLGVGLVALYFGYIN